MEINRIRITEYEPKEYLRNGEIVGEIEQKTMVTVRVCAEWNDCEAIAEKMLTAYLRSNPGRCASYSISSR